MAESRMSGELDQGFFSDTYDIFSDSVYGQALDGSPRWDRYRPNHVTTEEWVELLGDDIDNLAHHGYSYWAAMDFIVATNETAASSGEQAFTDEEAEILLLAAITNDWGEAVVGDVNYELRTTDQVDQERSAWRGVFKELLGDEFIKHLHVVEDILFGKRETRLGRTWDTIERITYVDDALLAFHLSRRVEDQRLASHLRWMAAAGLSNQTGILLEYTKSMGVVSDYLSGNAAQIEEAYDTIEPTIFSDHGQVEKTRLEQYILARLIWQGGSSERTTKNNTKRNREATNRGIFGPGANFESRFLPDIDSVVQVVDAVRALGMRIVLTSGSFDLWHIGHARYLELAKSFGEFLIVGVDSDDKIRKRKGPARPIVPQSERLEVISHSRSVDAITLKQATDPKWKLIRAVRPDVLIATAETYTNDEIMELSTVCGRVEVLPPQATTSTSARIRRFYADTR